MSKNTYEGMFILDSTAYGRDHDALSSQVEGFITEAGGEIHVSRVWDERKLAYPIKGQRRGAYWIAYFTIDPAQVKKITRQCEIHDDILRQLVLKIHPHLVEAVLSHASGTTVEEETETTETTETPSETTEETTEKATPEKA